MSLSKGIFVSTQGFDKLSPNGHRFAVRPEFTEGLTTND